MAFDFSFLSKAKEEGTIEQGVTRTLADGTPDPEGEFHICESCHAVVPLSHNHIPTPEPVVEESSEGE